jgi:hypothetical protein
MNSVPYCLRPSWQSFSGHLLDTAPTEFHFHVPSFDDKEKIWLKESIPSEKELQDLRVKIIFARVLLALGIFVTTALDLVWWGVATLTIVPMVRAGVRTHLSNLISTLIMPIFALGIPFGYFPKVHHFRAFFPVGDRIDPDFRNYRHHRLGIWWSGFKNSPEFIGERLDLFPDTPQQLLQEQAQ